jgi:DNA-binding NarL/FixJ family response regulator
MLDLVKGRSSSAAVQVLLAFPKALTGRLIVEALNHDPAFQVAAHVSSPEAVAAFTRHANIHVALIALDLTTPGDGLDVLRRLRSDHSQIRGVLLLETPDSKTVVDSFRLGAKGVFCMATNGYDLLSRCILAVHQGQIWANTQELNWVMGALQDVDVASAPSSLAKAPTLLEFKKLSKREVDVVNLLADGLSNRDIARSLCLSENTIKNYLFRIFEKVGVSNRTELLLYAFRSPSYLKRERSIPGADDLLRPEQPRQKDPSRRGPPSRPQLLEP